MTEHISIPGDRPAVIVRFSAPDEESQRVAVILEENGYTAIRIDPSSTIEQRIRNLARIRELTPREP